MFRGLQKEEIVLLTHGDSVDKVADGFKVVARSGNIVAGKNSDFIKTFFIVIMILYEIFLNFHLKSLLCFICFLKTFIVPVGQRTATVFFPSPIWISLGSGLVPSAFTH
jgi:hypothetical protein